MKTITNSFDVINELYKPYKIEYKGKCIIFSSTKGKYILKENQNNLKEIYLYLKSRGFNNIPELVSDSRDDLSVFEYVDEINIPVEQKGNDLINLVSLLHNKTSYYKEVRSDTYKTIYEDILVNIKYLNNYYQELFNKIEGTTFMSPSEYLVIRNSSKIRSALTFCEKELDNYYELVKDKKKERVSLVHNNLRTDHLLTSENNYLISWDNAKIDTPVLDIVNLYKNEYLNIEFSEILKTYLTKYPLNEDEQKLFFILIALPPKIELSDIKNIRSYLDYIYKTEEILRPYYSEE